MNPHSSVLSDMVFYEHDNIAQFFKKPKGKPNPVARRPLGTHSSRNKQDQKAHDPFTTPKKASKLKRTDKLFDQLVETNVVKTLKRVIAAKKTMDLNDPEIQSVLSSLGRVHFKDSLFLFEQDSKELDDHVKAFQKMFFDNNAELIDEVQLTKFSVNKRNRPSCLLHAQVEISGVDHCVIAPSRSVNPNDDKEIMTALEMCAQQYNREKPVLSCTVLSSYNNEFDSLLEQLLNYLGLDQPEHNGRACAEKLVIREIAKLIYQNPSSVRVKAVKNIANYPYLKGQVYGKGQNKHVSPIKSNTDNVLEVGNYQLELWPCCKNCQALYPAFLGYLAAVREMAIAKQVIDFSPAKTAEKKDASNGKEKIGTPNGTPSKVLAKQFEGINVGDRKDASLTPKDSARISPCKRKQTCLGETEKEEGPPKKKISLIRVNLNKFFEVLDREEDDSLSIQEITSESGQSIDSNSSECLTESQSPFSP